MGGDGGGGATTVTTTTQTGGTATGTGTATTTSTGTGAGGFGGQGGCDAYGDAAGLSELTVRLRNDSGLPIFLPAHCGVVRYELSASPPDDTQYAFDPFCLQTCEDLQLEGVMDCANCEPSSVLLAAGATLDLRWDGTGLRSADMPLSCWAMPGQQEACPQQVAAALGSYRVFAMGYASCGDADGACACDSTGLCYGDASGLEAYADSVLFEWPTPLVEVVFGACAFPCPEAP